MFIFSYFQYFVNDSDLCNNDFGWAGDWERLNGQHWMKMNNE